MADEPRGLPVPKATPGAAQNVGVATPAIPGRLVGGTAITVTQYGPSWTVNLSVGELGPAPAHDFTKTWVPAWFDDTDETYRIALSDLSASLPVAWNNITGKPATFPPTLPIPSSGVTGLDAALAGIAGDLNALDGRLDTIDAQLVDTDRGDIVTTSGFMVWTIDANAVTNDKLRDSAALSVIGRSANSSGDPADIAAGTDGHVLRRAGTALGFGTIATAGYADDSVTNAKLANVPTATFKGRATGGTGDPEDLTATQATALLNAFVGDSGTGGTKGLTPAPSAGDAAAGKVLGADGTWVTQPGAVPAGQCELIKSDSNIVLVPRNGNVININGVNRNISASGASLAPTGLTVSSLYYVYAYWTGSAVALEASTTGHSTNSTTGVETKTDDATRTLVGAVRPIAGPAFADTETQRFVASWFNPPELTLRAQVTATQTTTSTSFVELTTSLRVEMIVLKRVVPHVSITGLVSNSGGAVSLFAAGYDVISVVSEASGYAGASLVPMTHSDARQLSEGYHSITVVGAVSAASTAILAGALAYPVIIRATL